MYCSGSKTSRDKVFIVETLENGEFVPVGEILVTVKEVVEKVDDEKVIKSRMYYSIAQILAEKKYPDKKPLVLYPKDASCSNCWCRAGCPDE